MSYLIDALHVIGRLFLVLLIFNFIIIVHEWGHFLAARWRGLKIEKFQIWMGKPIWKRTWNGVQYGLGTIPLGGFVQLPQMAPMEAIEGKSGEKGEPLPPIKPLDKIIVAFAGPLFSFLLAFGFACLVALVGKPVKPQEVTRQIGYTALGMPASEPGMLKAGDIILEIDGAPIKRFFGLTNSIVWAIASGRSDDVVFKIQRPGEPEPRTVTVHAPLKASEQYKKWDRENGWLKKLVSRPPLRMVGLREAAEGKVKEVKENSPAAEAGIQKGDIILTINGGKSYNPLFVHELAAKRPAEPIEVTVQRGDKVEKATIIPRIPDEPKDAKEARTGIEFEELDPDHTEYVHPSPFTLVADCFRGTVANLRALMSPSSNIGMSQMSGPVGILNLYYTIFQNPEWWRLVLWFSVVLNVGLAVFNMLPLPVLDGGHITLGLMEMIRRRPVHTKVLEFIQLACVLLLLSFVLFVTLKDFGHIFSGEKDIPERFLPRKAAPAPP